MTLKTAAKVSTDIEKSVESSFGFFYQRRWSFWTLKTAEKLSTDFEKERRNFLCTFLPTENGAFGN